MHIYEKEDFEKLAKGQRECDIRLFDNKRKELRPNDFVILICNKTEERCILRVKELHVYENGSALLQAEQCWELYEKCGKYYSLNEQIGTPVVLIKYRELKK